jgi:two-component system chemotaxis response regulator CheY
MRILIVDDSGGMRMIVTRCLNAAHVGKHTIVEAPSAEAALGLVESDPPDLILCDWHMGRMTGLSLLESLRSSGCDVTFGFVTADGEPETRAAALAAGAAFLLTKPFTPESIREVIGPFLSRP